MSIFGTILSKIWGGGDAQPSQASPGAASTTAQSGPAPSTPATGTAASAQPVDVEAVLTQLAAENKEKLDWRKSIVDLMKLLNLDSSLGARKELARELHYTGDTGDTASMNIWLHKQVMIKLAENGGKVPADLRH
jgi:hypothetical protein